MRSTRCALVTAASITVGSVSWMAAPASAIRMPDIGPAGVIAQLYANISVNGVPLPVTPEDIDITVGEDHEDGTTTIIIDYPGGVEIIDDFPTILIPPLLRHGPRQEEPPASGSQGEVDETIADGENCYQAAERLGVDPSETC